MNFNPVQGIYELDTAIKPLDELRYVIVINQCNLKASK
jgi:hypothetical protein